MLMPRIIPCLLVLNKGLVKTYKFKKPKYVGDPINAVKIFNEKSVDELIVIDIGATVEGKVPDYKMIENLAIECRMPLCYGGGIRTIQQAEKILQLGVEKVAISSAAIYDYRLIDELSKIIGTQSIVVVIDVKKRFLDRRYYVMVNNGKTNTGKDPIKLVEEIQGHGIGEIVINSIDNDGVMEGYDYQLIEGIMDKCSVPVTVLGGCSSLDDMGKLIRKYGIIGAAAGSIFVFKGIYRAVLINYPKISEKEKLIKDNYNKFVKNNKCGKL